MFLRMKNLEVHNFCAQTVSAGYETNFFFCGNERRSECATPSASHIP